VVTWIAWGLVLLGLVVLLLASLPVIGRLGPLRRAALRMRRHHARIESLQGAALTLQERVEPLLSQVETAQRRLAVIQAKRGR
jgi:hypothetical protein